MGTRAGGTAEKNRDHEQSLKNPHSLPHDQHFKLPRLSGRQKQLVRFRIKR
jgi:hypothetical protein